MTISALLEILNNEALDDLTIKQLREIMTALAGDEDEDEEDSDLQRHIL